MLAGGGNLSPRVHQSWPTVVATLRLEYGAKDIYLFGSALWKVKPHDMDIAVSGVPQERTVELILSLEKVSGLPVDVFLMETLSPTLLDYIYEFGRPASDLFAQRYDVHQLRRELALRREHVDLLNNTDPILVWEEFEELLEFIRRKVNWEHPSEDDDNAEELIQLFSDIFPEKIIAYLNALSMAPNQTTYQEQSYPTWQEWNAQEAYSQMEDSILSWAEQELEADRWPPAPPEGVPQPRRDWELRSRKAIAEAEAKAEAAKVRAKAAKAKAEEAVAKLRAKEVTSDAFWQRARVQEEANEAARQRAKAQDERRMRELAEAKASALMAEAEVQRARAEEAVDAALLAQGEIERLQRQLALLSVGNDQGKAERCLALLPALRALLQDQKDVMVFLMDMRGSDWHGLRDLLGSAERNRGNRFVLQSLRARVEKMPGASEAIVSFVVEHWSELIQNWQELNQARSKFF